MSTTGVPDGYVETAFLSGYKYYVVFDHERWGYAVFTEDDHGAFT